MKYMYVLDGHEPVLEHDLMKWARWFETADRTVRRTEHGNMMVSTVFLGLDHNFDDDGPPVLFETMVFTGNETGDWDMVRYCTWDEAEAGHLRMCESVFGAAFQIHFSTKGVYHGTV